MINVLLNRSQSPAPPPAEPSPSCSDKGKGPLTRKSSLQSEKNSLFEKLSNLLGRGGQSSVQNEDADFEVIRDTQTEELLRQLKEKLEKDPTPSIAPRDARPQLAATKTFWLTKCQLELNSQMPGN